MTSLTRSRKPSTKHVATPEASSKDDHTTKPTTEVDVSPAVHPIASPPPPSPDLPTALLSFPVPPSISTLPTPPADFIPAKTVNFRGVTPIQTEQSDLAAAIQDLGKIPNYALFVGAPPLDSFIALLTLCGQWTGMRNASAKWDAYAQTQEGNVWTSARPRMQEFNDAFTQAQKADPTLAAKLPGLVNFLGARSAVAQKSASTKRANKSAKAKGERPTHGLVGKQLTRAAEKAALAAADANAANGATSGTAAPAPATNGAPKSTPA